MRKKNGVTLYVDLITVVLICGLLLIVLAKQKGTEYRNRQEKEIGMISTYTDYELIEKYYKIDAELQNELNQLQLHQSKVMAKSQDKNWGSSMTQGFSEGVITAKIKMLRNIKTALLTEIYKRELKLPR
ncbi:hypothetical protein HQ584_06540 [Patescibacteria group bacterium]|nr:hypothetical protein [Patescibacteria group bacterium]